MLCRSLLKKYSLRKCAQQILQYTTATESTEKPWQNLPGVVFGQPTPSTHPHLVKEGEVIPGITLAELKNRREKFTQAVRMHENIGQSSDVPFIAIIPSASKVYMSDSIPYVFRQNTDFLYLTGCQEPDSVLLITSVGEKTSSTLFVRKKDAHAELWDGPRTGVQASKKLFGVDSALPVTEFDKFIASFLAEHKKCFLLYESAAPVQQAIHQKISSLKMNNSQSLLSPKTFLHQLRIIKSIAEIELMKRSCSIAAKAIAKTIQVSKPGMSEHQLFATVDYECRMHGAEFLAYPPVVASGLNANTIHYIINNQIAKKGDLVLMDAGCEYHGYTSDITRTWPIDGSFTPEQRVLYEVVLETQKTLITKLKEMPSLDDVFHDMCLIMGQQLQEIGLIPKDLQGNNLISAAYSYCPHHVSHYLGMDVHDTGKIPRSVTLKPGMIVTMEPGIYVNHNSSAPREFHGIGIRIEDDVLIQSTGGLVLSRECPKEIDEIEALARTNVH